MKSLPKALIIVGILAICVRVWFLYLTVKVPFGINGDQTRYEDWAQVVHIYGLRQTYKGGFQKTVPTNQPPGSLYIISATYETYILVGKAYAKITNTDPGSNLFINTHLLHIMMRIPSILSDILMGIIAYLFVVKEAGKKRATLAASLIWLNPVVFYNSAVWGQMDSLNNLLLVLSLFLVTNKKYIWSIIAFATSIYIKLTALPLLPAYLLYVFFHSEKNIKKIATGVILALTLMVVATYPVSNTPVNWLLTEIPAMSGGELGNITVAAFNFWWILTCDPLYCDNDLPLIGDKFLGITLNNWGYLLFATATIPVLLLQLVKSKELIQKRQILLVLGIMSIATFQFLPRMHDRYLYTLFPLLAMAICLGKRAKKYSILFGLLSLIYMGNIIYSFYPTLYPSFIFYQVIYGNPFRWIVAVLLFIGCAIVYVKSISNFRKSLINQNSTKSKILWLSWKDITHPDAGGAEQSGQMHSEAWIKAGYSIDWISTGYKNSRVATSRNGVNFYHLGSKWMWYLGLIHILVAYKYITDWQYKYDIVIDEIHGPPFLTPLYVKKPIIAVIHEVAGDIWKVTVPFPISWIAQHVVEPLFFKAYRNTNFVVGAQTTKDDLIKIGIPEKKIALIPYGVTKPEVIKHYEKENKPTLIFLSSLRPVKGFDRVYSAFKKIKAKVPEIKLWVVGDDSLPYGERCKQEVTTDNMKESVEFFGRVTQDKKFELLQKAHILVHGSYKEGWGLVVIEANLVGTPAIVFDAAGLRNSVKDKFSGRIVFSESEFTQSVIELLESKELYNTYKINAKDWSSQFSWQSATELSLKLLSQMQE